MSALTRFRSPRGEVMALPTSVAVWLPYDADEAVLAAEASVAAAGACWAGADAQPPRIRTADKVQGMTEKRKTDEFMGAGPREVMRALRGHACGLGNQAPVGVARSPVRGGWPPVCRAG